MTCREVERLLPELLDDALGGEQRLRLDAHLDSCADCRQVVNELERSLALFVAQQPSVQALATEKLWRRVRTEALERRGPQGRIWATALIPSLAGAAALIVVALMLWLPRPAGDATDSHIALGTPEGPVRVTNAEPTIADTPPAESPGGTAAAERAETTLSPGTEPTPVRPAGDSERTAASRHPRALRPAARPPAGRTPPPPVVVAESPPDVPGDLVEPVQPTETHGYAVVVTAWTVWESDQVLTMAAADAPSDGAAAEPVRTSLYAVVPRSYAVRATTCVFDAAAVTGAALEPMPESTREGSTDTSDAGSLAGAVHTS